MALAKVATRAAVRLAGNLKGKDIGACGMSATEKHFPPYHRQRDATADTQGNAESWVTPNRALRYKGAIEFRLLSFVYQEGRRARER